MTGDDGTVAMVEPGEGATVRRRGMKSLCRAPVMVGTPREVDKRIGHGQKLDIRARQKPGLGRSVQCTQMMFLRPLSLRSVFPLPAHKMSHVLHHGVTTTTTVRPANTRPGGHEQTHIPYSRGERARMKFTASGGAEGPCFLVARPQQARRGKRWIEEGRTRFN